MGIYGDLAYLAKSQSYSQIEMILQVLLGDLIKQVLNFLPEFGFKCFRS